jgi:hypothetical protein
MKAADEIDNGGVEPATIRTAVLDYLPGKTVLIASHKAFSTISTWVLAAFPLAI